MFSGTIGQHLPKESWGFVKVGFPLGSLSTVGGTAENSFRKSKNSPKPGNGTEARECPLCHQPTLAPGRQGLIPARGYPSCWAAESMSHVRSSLGSTGQAEPPTCSPHSIPGPSSCD